MNLVKRIIHNTFFKRKQSLLIIFLLIFSAVCSKTNILKASILIKSKNQTVLTCSTANEISSFLKTKYIIKNQKSKNPKYLYFYLSPSEKLKNVLCGKTTDEKMAIWAKNMETIQKYDVIFNTNNKVYYRNTLPDQLLQGLKQSAKTNPGNVFIIRFDIKKMQVSEIINDNNHFIYIRGLKIVKIH